MFWVKLLVLLLIDVLAFLWLALIGGVVSGCETDGGGCSTGPLVVAWLVFGLAVAATLGLGVRAAVRRWRRRGFRPRRV